MSEWDDWALAHLAAELPGHRMDDADADAAFLAHLAAYAGPGSVPTMSPESQEAWAPTLQGITDRGVVNVFDMWDRFKKFVETQQPVNPKYGPHKVPEEAIADWPYGVVPFIQSELPGLPVERHQFSPGHNRDVQELVAEGGFMDENIEALQALHSMYQNREDPDRNPTFWHFTKMLQRQKRDMLPDQYKQMTDLLQQRREESSRPQLQQARWQG
jgi:hypothetical protein